MEQRYHYVYGYKTRAAAQESLATMIAWDEIHEGEDPKIESYITAEGKTRYAITLAKV